MTRWVSLCLIAIGGAAFGSLAARVCATRTDHTTATAPLFKSDAHYLKLRIAFSNAMTFERDHQLRSRFGNCRDTGERYNCSASTAEGVLVAYHCDADGCAIDCATGAVK